MKTVTSDAALPAENIAPEATGWTKFAVIYIAIMATSYGYIEQGAGFGPLKLLMLALATVLAYTAVFRFSTALLCGGLYLGWQFLSASFHMETWRWGTLIFSVLLVSSYICMYNLIYIEKVFTVDNFIKLVKGLIFAYFIVCILQQCCIIIGIRTFPLLNLWQYLNRGWGCNSLSMEPSSFARTMLVCYYCYIKCNEYKRNKGRFSPKELLSGEHKKVTLCFLWMMTTMGSGAAYGCLIALSCYFITKKNYGILLPLLLGGYFALQYLPQPEQMRRATSVINATMGTRDVKEIQAVDVSASSRIAPVINSFNADFTKIETWFGHGIDYAKNNNLVNSQKGTLFDDYGFCFYLIALLLDFLCAYRFFSLATVFMLMGVAGGAGGNIHYGWTLMILMTCERYFYETQKDYQEKDKVTQ